MTKNEIVSMAGSAPTYLGYPITQNRIPGDGEFRPEDVTGVGDSLVPDLEACRDSVKEFIYEGDIPSGSYAP